MNIEVFPTPELLAEAAVELFRQVGERSVFERGKFCVALSGGETPRMTYELLAKAKFSQEFWSKVRFFWGDERGVPETDPRSNYGQARASLLDHIPVRADQIHPIHFSVDMEEAALSYEKELRGLFPSAGPSFDLTFLGLGSDGHTASLFPTDSTWQNSSRWVVPAENSVREMSRVSLTPGILNHSRVIAFLVSGESKAEKVKQICFGADHLNSPNLLPAQWIKPDTGELFWYLDQAAAAGKS